MADDINDIRFLKELENHGGDIYDWAEYKMEENNAFFGEDVNEEKVNLLQDMIGYANQIAELDKDFTVKPFLINNRDANAGVQLQTGLVGYMTKDQRVKDLLAKLNTSADMISVSALSEKILMNYDVLNVWNTTSKIYDREKKKSENDG